MKLFALSITILLARAGAEIGPHLLDGTDTPTLHRDIARHQLSIEDLLTPFAGKKTGLAFRVHADNDAKTTDGGVADAIVAALRESGLPTDPAEAATVLKESPVPLSTGLFRLDRLQRQGRRRQVCLGGRLYVVVHELGRGSAPRTQRRPQLSRRGLHDQVERWYSVERRAL